MMLLRVGEPIPHQLRVDGYAPPILGMDAYLHLNTAGTYVLRPVPILVPWYLKFWRRLTRQPKPVLLISRGPDAFSVVNCTIECDGSFVPFGVSLGAMLAPQCEVVVRL